MAELGVVEEIDTPPEPPKAQEDQQPVDAAAVLEAFLRSRPAPPEVVLEDLETRLDYLALEVSFANHHWTRVPPPSAEPVERRCISCYDNSPHSLAACDCIPTMCSDCIRSFIQIGIAGATFQGRCLSCRTTYSDTFLRELISPESFEMFDTQRARREAARDPTAVFCANPECEKILRRTGCSVRVTCDSCNTTVCCRCGRAHSAFYPCSIRDFSSNMQFQMWKLGGGEVANGVKRCPNCNIFIEKNDGCQHMTCTHCRHEFCWHCSKTHGQGHYITCPVKKALGHPIWGRSMCVRATTKTIGIPVIIGAGAAAVGIGLALGAAAVAISVPSFLCYGFYRCCKSYHDRTRRPIWSGEYGHMPVWFLDIGVEGSRDHEIFQTLANVYPNGRVIEQGHYLAYTTYRDRPVLVYFRSWEITQTEVEPTHRVMMRPEGIALAGADSIEPALQNTFAYLLDNPATVAIRVS